ncbi:MAG: hypothetical protein CMP98_05995 [Gammaproteobacteria bacterium]|nr:hypothetical protein [Gammaproteobacteria bacterium]MAW28329.1 hypothetical protein [Gammaproteobacteria bacterium]OUU09908.1 MAG: hypothetical protein CBB94_06090 [Gammaproteobacteria bacterium TMED34]|tara:strand:- start:1207 stop:1389 length:183 start_codon:yes stop_codon:yes gene_type:complete
MFLAVVIAYSVTYKRLKLGQIVSRDLAVVGSGLDNLCCECGALICDQRIWIDALRTKDQM